MTRMTRLFSTVIAIAVLGTWPAWAHDDEPVGREVAAYGTLEEREGTLQYMRDEWFIVTNGDEYELHLGPYGHADEPPFVDGETGTARGFVWTDHMAPIAVETDRGTQEFWTEQRLPIWAGSGEGGGRVAHTNPDIEPPRREAVDELALGERLGDPEDRRFVPPEDRRFAPPSDRQFQPPEDLEPRFRNEPPGLGRRNR